MTQESERGGSRLLICMYAHGPALGRSCDVGRAVRETTARIYREKGCIHTSENLHGGIGPKNGGSSNGKSMERAKG